MLGLIFKYESRQVLALFFPIGFSGFGGLFPEIDKN